MHRLPELAWLCDVISDSLSCFTESSQLSPLTKENEKHILIILSQIATRIRESKNAHHTQSASHHQPPKLGDDFHDCFAHIISHLMLMIRLCFKVHQEYSMLILWLQLLHKYFQDLLLQPISKNHSALDDCLEGSPFLSCVSDGQKDVHHLQRQAVFLFLKCCFDLINLRKEIDSKCSCSTAAPCLNYEVQSDQECCIWMKGLLELSEWLNKHVSLTTFVDYELYMEKCVCFASSFIKLYIDELHYDHSVLLDYLISEDSGIHCLQYLLRSLRTISNSWNFFLEFPMWGDVGVLSSCKRRKLSICGLDSDGDVELVSAKRKGRSYLKPFDHKSNTYDNSDSVLNNTTRRHYQNAKDCLFLLKSAVENFHQKNLFPYNPQALLRSFTRFEELCHQQERLYVQKLER